MSFCKVPVCSAISFRSLHYSTSYISDTCYFVYALCILVLLIEFAFIDSKRNVTLRVDFCAQFSSVGGPQVEGNDGLVSSFTTITGTSGKDQTI